MLFGPFTPWLALGSLVALIGSYFYGHHAGGTSCERDHQTAALQATQALHAQYVAEKERGDKIAVALQAERRENQRLRGQHADNARLLTGTCPNGLRVLHDAAASGKELSEAAFRTLNQTGTVAASEVAEAVTGNYATARDCQKQLNALIDWHSK